MTTTEREWFPTAGIDGWWRCWQRTPGGNVLRGYWPPDTTAQGIMEWIRHKEARHE